MFFKFSLFVLTSILAFVILIQQPCHVGDAAVIVPECVAKVLHEGLGVHVVAVIVEHK